MAKINLFVGSVYGGAEALAEKLKKLSDEHGHQASLYLPGTVQDVCQSEVAIVVTSTTGQGDIPPELEALYLALTQNRFNLEQVSFAVIAMGDSSYGDTFCGAGIKFDALLEQLQATRLCEVLKVDAMEHFEPETAALPWYQQLLNGIK